MILAGVRDIKNSKVKMRSEKEQEKNSPWNIAADFGVEMSLSKAWIAGMLKDYEEDYHTGMDIVGISEMIFEILFSGKMRAVPSAESGNRHGIYVRVY